MQQETVLVIDDEDDIRNTLKMIFEYEGYRYLPASDGYEGLRLAKDETPAIIFLDIKMPGMDGIEVLQELIKQKISAPVVLISGHATVPLAVEATKLGAFDFLEKPLERDRLLLLTRNALMQKKLQDENRDLRGLFEKKYEIIGESTAIENMKEEILAAAPTNATVIISGESGTGKELAARMIHRNSKRSSKDFIQVNCAAIPEELIESELFGHEKGSFTGATERQIGKFEMAHLGTIFLDEIGDMSAGTQAKVLRVLEEGEIETIGSGRVKKVDVRVLSATNKNLEEEILHNRFREDLYYRLNVIPIHLSPLREKKSDIPLLIEHFARSFCLENNFKLKRFSDEAVRLMQRYAWKGNIRELKNVVERLVIMVSEKVIDIPSLPVYIRTESSAGSSGGMMEEYAHMTLREFKETAEKDFLINRLKENNWNILKTAEVIDTPRSNLYKKIQQYQIRQEEEEHR